MQKNKHHFKTANEIFHEQVAECYKKKPNPQYPFSTHHNFTSPKHNNPNKIDTFWEAYNSSRCKTAMLCISIIVTAGFIVTEATENPSLKLHQVMIILLGYWMGRTSKAKENRLMESRKHE